MALEINLGIAYYNQGFFNVPVAYNDLFGVDKESIKIQLGASSTNIVQGYINRTANPNGTPRIMGGNKLKKWIQHNFNQNDILRVEIQTKVSIILHTKD